MNTTKLPWGAMPDVLSYAGVTYVAYSTGQALVIYVQEEANGYNTLVYRDEQAKGVGWPRLKVVGGRVVVAYKSEPSQLLVVADVVTGAWRPVPNLALWGNHPLCWDIALEGVLTVQVGNQDGSYNSTWQGVGMDMQLVPGAAFAPDGLAFTVYKGIILSKDYKVQGMYNPSVASNAPDLIVGENGSGGVRVHLDERRGVLHGGQWTANPRATWQPGNRVAVAYWSPPEKENALTLVTNIAMDEIAEMGPPVKVEPLGYSAVGSFYCTSRQYGDFMVPGNFEVLLDGDDFNAMKIKRPVIAGELARNVPDNMVMGYFATNESVFGRIREKANPRAFVYTDNRQADSFRRFDGLYRSGDVLLPQVYMNDETPETFEKSINYELDRLTLWYPSMKQVLVLGADDRGYHSDLTLQNLMPVYDRLLRRQNVFGGVFFSWGRPRGVVSHPSLIPWVEAFFRASLGIPAALMPRPLPTEPVGLLPPKVNIVQYDKVLTSENKWSAFVTDGNNPGFEVVIEFVEGSLHVRLRNPKGTDRSGLPRIVDIY